MSKTISIPKYGLHKATGQARVILGGVHHYLGKYGSQQSHRKYAILLERHLDADSKIGSEDKPTIPENGHAHQITVDELIAAYLEHAEEYYSRNGKRTSEYTSMAEALRHLRPRYGATMASEFGPKRLKQVREFMIGLNLARSVINNRINRIKRCFKWGVSEELIPSSVYEALRTVGGLRFGRCCAKETKPIKPAPPESVDRIVSIVCPQIASMIQLQRLTGMRPGEVVIMRGCDIDFSGSIWVYEPAEHKNKYRGHSRLIPLGPQAQSIIRPFLGRPENAFLFSPKEAEEWRNKNRRLDRKSPLTPSQRNRKRKNRPKRRKGERYDTASYRRAIKYAIQKHNRKHVKEKMAPWHPHQLRHLYATELRKRYGAEAVQIGLGHKSTDLIDLYAEKNLAAAITMAAKIG